LIFRLWKGATVRAFSQFPPTNNAMNSSAIISSPSFFPFREIPQWRGALAALVLVLVAPLAQAGTAELALLNAYLSTHFGDSVTTATSAQLAQAVVAVLQANPTKNGGTIAGEALKGAGSNAPDAGAQIASAVLTAFPSGTVPLGTKTLTYQAFAVQAIKTAATGTGLNVAQVPGFTAPFVASDSDAIALAVLVKASKPAVNAVFQGRAGELTSDTDKEALANQALKTTTLATVVQDVAAGVATKVADPVAFTNVVLTAPDNLKNVLKIVPGIVSGQPTAAGAIVEQAFTSFAAQGIASPIVKGAAALATSVGAVADIEQVQRVGTAIAERIGAAGGQVIKYSQLNAIATTLAKAIASKPLTATGPNRNANKVDELGELAAYMLDAVVTNTDFLKAPDKNVIAFIKAIIAGAKSTYGPSTLDITNYVVGSVALTIQSLPVNTPGRSAILATLQLPATAKTIGGTALAGVVSQAISTGIAGTGIYENGTDAATGAVTDPETNSKNL
jgi:hypothetical protein